MATSIVGRSALISRTSDGKKARVKIVDIDRSGIVAEYDRPSPASTDELLGLAPPTEVVARRVRLQWPSFGIESIDPAW